MPAAGYAYAIRDFSDVDLRNNFLKLLFLDVLYNGNRYNKLTSIQNKTYDLHLAQTIYLRGIYSPIW